MKKPPQDVIDAVQFLTASVAGEFMVQCSHSSDWCDLVGRVAAMMENEIARKGMTPLASMVDTLDQMAKGTIAACRDNPGDVTPNSVASTTAAMLVALVMVATTRDDKHTQH